MTPTDAVTEKHRSRGTPDACYGCKHSYCDIEEGWNCRKYDGVVELADGTTMSWYGQACDRAYDNDCKGAGFERHLVPGIARKHPIVSIIVFSVVGALVMTSLTCVR
jgi:hypothetical protein